MTKLVTCVCLEIACESLGNRFPENNCDKSFSLVLEKSNPNFFDKLLFKIIRSGDFTGVGKVFDKKISGNREYVLSKCQPMVIFKFN